MLAFGYSPPLAGPSAMSPTRSVHQHLYTQVQLQPRSYLIVYYLRAIALQTTCSWVWVCWPTPLAPANQDLTFLDRAPTLLVIPKPDGGVLMIMRLSDFIFWSWGLACSENSFSSSNSPTTRLTYHTQLALHTSYAGWLSWTFFNTLSRLGRGSLSLRIKQNSAGATAEGSSSVSIVTAACSDLGGRITQGGLVICRRFVTWHALQ